LAVGLFAKKSIDGTPCAIFESRALRSAPTLANDELAPGETTGFVLNSAVPVFELIPGSVTGSAGSFGIDNFEAEPTVSAAEFEVGIPGTSSFSRGVVGEPPDGLFIARPGGFRLFVFVELKSSRLDWLAPGTIVVPEAVSVWLGFDGVNDTWYSPNDSPSNMTAMTVCFNECISVFLDHD
jgi:hypothetical protein